jgi:predicted ester cyclase
MNLASSREFNDKPRPIPVRDQPAFLTAVAEFARIQAVELASRNSGEFRYEQIVGGSPVDGDQVVVRWRATGTHTGEGLGIPATGRTGAFCGMTWVRVEAGQLVEGWQCSNIPEVLRGFASRPPAFP